MMNCSMGFLLHVETGEVIRVQLPEGNDEYEFDWDEVGVPFDIHARGEWQEGMMVALCQGWMLVRQLHEVTTIEFMVQEWEAAFESAAQALSELALGDYCWITFCRVSTGESLGIHVFELKSRFLDGTISELLDRIETL